MARSIDFGTETFLDATAIVGFKGGVTDENIDQLVYKRHCGMYYGMGVTINGYARYGILFVLCSATSGTVGFVQHVFISNGRSWTRQRSGNTFGVWNEIAVPPITVDGNNYIDVRNVYSSSYEASLQSMYFVRPATTQVLSDITLNTSGHYDLSSAVESVLPQGRRVVSIGVERWTESNGAWSIVEYGERRGWIVGTPGVVIKGLQLVIWYA